MARVEPTGKVEVVNKFKIRARPDKWHDVAIPGLDDEVPTVPGKREENKIPLEDRGSSGHAGPKERAVINDGGINRENWWLSS